MQHLTDAQRDTLRRALEDERDALMRLRQQEATDAVAAADSVPDVGDQQDAAAREAATLAHWTLADHERARLEEIEAALRRMHDGTYGICEHSDEPISFARLEIEPTARATVEAQEEYERERTREGLDATEKRRAY